ncbi:MAG: SUMF1/EgtB/PvdO family nonheme iron enzyme, partial [Rhodospirillales bacterium]|nr:SUMF1/EgtB/PvdO family nonheme iron enzyme [Acetobacter sp.]
TTFTMGNPSPTAPANEQPTTRVTLSRFFISRFPITNAEYERYDLAHASRRGAWADDNHPVIYVSNQDAVKFCQWLSARDKRRYRLPTEAEWEYAAKGGDGRTFPWGEATGRGDLANYADANTTFAWRDGTVDDGFAETSPVGAYPDGASPFGVEDLAGNVWEWCLDDYDAYKGGDRANPRVVKAGGQRVYRGGSWKSRFASLKSTARGYNLPTYASNDVGFRVVCECD